MAEDGHSLAAPSRYSAFISYSHADSAVARWLHRAIETYVLPKALVGQHGPFGPVPRRLPPVFRDRDELPASADLGSELRAALADARFQIVLCSPKSAKSVWVNEEILAFKRLHGEARVLPVIIAGEPYAGGDAECFPPALRFRLGADGMLSDVPAEPIAADIRPGKDGRRLALLKLVAGITGLRLDALAQRDIARRQRRLLAITSSAVAVSLVTIGLAIYANIQREAAVRQQRVADRSLAFLVDTFAIANPATENPRSITALTILGRASHRAAAELPDEPLVSARLLSTTGEIYLNLGQQREGIRDLEAALARLPRLGTDRARMLLTLARAATAAADNDRGAQLIDAASVSYGRRDADSAALDAAIAEQRGLLAHARGNFADAAGWLAKAAAGYRALPGDRREAVGRVLSSEARARMKLRQLSEAERLFAQTEALSLAQFGRDHVQTAAAAQNIAYAAFEAGRVADAKRGITRATKTYARVLEGDHPRLADALILEGRIRTASGDAEGAAAALRRAQGIFLRLFGPMNAAVGDAAFYLAEAESRRGRMPAALQQVATAKAIYDIEYGPDDPDQVELLLLKARVLAAGGQHVEAGAACNAAIGLNRRIGAEAAVIADAVKQCGSLSLAPATSQARPKRP